MQHPTVKTARIAGAIYLLMVVAGPFLLMYIPEKLIVRGNATATAANILAQENLFRWAIVGDLLMPVVFISLGLALYRLLNSVNRLWALLMLSFVLVSSAVAFLNTINYLAAGILVRGADFLSVFDKGQRDALAMLFLRLHNQGDFINEIFWGLWLLPLGLLIFRSGFLPRFIGVWLIINCFTYLVLSPTALFFPHYYPAAFRFATPFLFGELALMLWLLIKGARVPSHQIDHTVSSASYANT